MKKAGEKPALVYVKRWKGRNSLTKWKGTVSKAKTHESLAIIWRWGTPIFPVQLPGGKLELLSKNFLEDLEI